MRREISEGAVEDWEALAADGPVDEGAADLTCRPRQVHRTAACPGLRGQARRVLHVAPRGAVMRARLVETDDTAGAVASHVFLLGVCRSLPGSARENGAPDNTNASGPENLTSRRQRPEKMRRRSRSRAYFVQITTAPHLASEPENSAGSDAAPR